MKLLYVRDIFGPVDAGRKYAVVSMIMLVCPVIAPSLGTFLLKINWQAIFIFHAIYASGVLLFYLNFIPVIPDDINWDTTFATNTNEENNVIHRNGVFLVGDASVTMPPHIAQAGNQTLEDTAFIKKCLQENNNFKQMINMFIKHRYVKKNIISKKSRSIGKILSAQKLIGHLRNLSLKAYGNEVLETVLNPIWASDINE